MQCVMLRFSFGLMGLILLAGCVPKTQYEDQQLKLKETQANLRQLEQTSQECNPNAFIELKEQAQSLDILTQELLNRNTELSEEVARLRVYESQVKSQNFQCDKQLSQAREDCEQRLARTRQTYEDLVAELRKRLSQAEKELAGLKGAAAAPKSEEKNPAQPQKKN